MKKLIALTLSVVMLLSILAGCGSSSAPAAQSSSAPAVNAPAAEAPASNAQVLKFDLTCSMDHPWGIAAQHFTELLEKETNGAMTTEIFPSGTSGSEVDSLAGMLTGTTDMTTTGGSFVSYSPMAALLEAPYAFGSEEDVKAMMESEIGDAIRQAYEEQGFHCLWYQLRGPRELTSNKPINSAADMQNVKMRMSGNPLHNSMWVACGAITSTMSMTDCFTALSQGVVETQENPLDYIYDYSFNEVQKYVNLTNHVYSAIMIVLSADTYNALSPENKAAVDKVAAEMQEYVNNYYDEYKDTFRAKLEEGGMTFNEDVDIDSFKAAMIPVVEEYMTSQGILDYYQQICEMSSK